jgi:hypothetical protein
MPDRATGMSSFDLDAQLTALGGELSWAPTPDLVAGVIGAPTSPAPVHFARRRRWLLAAAVLAVLLGGAILLGSGTVRTSVADFFGIDGLRIEFGEPDTTPVSHPVLGTPTTMQNFERWLPFTPMQPAALGVPDAVYLRVLETGQFVGVSAWDPTDTLPEASETGFGAVLMQFTAPSEATFLLKTLDLRVSTVTETEVDGNDGYWVEGVSSITIAGAAGSESRPSANVLIWQQNGIGFRLETALSMSETIAIAETLEPMP